MKLTGHVAVLRCGREVQVAEEVENVSFDRHAGRRHRLCDWRHDGISTEQVKDVLTLQAYTHTQWVTISFSETTVLDLSLFGLRPN